jgi:hypothetical protein
VNRNVDANFLLSAAQRSSEQAQGKPSGFIQPTAPLARAHFGQLFATMNTAATETMRAIHKLIDYRRLHPLRFGVVGAKFGNRIHPFLWARQLANKATLPRLSTGKHGFRRTKQKKAESG